MGKKTIDFTDEEMAQRLPVWVALTYIFVNVDQTEEEFESDLNFIAGNLADLGLSIQTLEDILKEEIGPIFVRNFSIWMSFPETEGWSAEGVESIMKANRAKKNTLDGLWKKIFKNDPFKNKTVAKRWGGIKRRLKDRDVPESFNSHIDWYESDSHLDR